MAVSIAHALEEAFGKQEISENSNLVRKNLLANIAFCSEEMSGIIFTSESLMPVGGSGNRRVLRSTEVTSLLHARKVNIATSN